MDGMLLNLLCSTFVVVSNSVQSIKPTDMTREGTCPGMAPGHPRVIPRPFWRVWIAGRVWVWVWMGIPEGRPELLPNFSEAGSHLTKVR